MSQDPLALLSGGLFNAGAIAGPSSGTLTEIVDVRTAIRRHVVDALRFQSTAQDRIYVTPFIPIDGDRLHASGPILLVYTGNERVDNEDPYSHAPPRPRVYLELFVRIVCSTFLPDVQDALDAIALAVRSIVLRPESQAENCNETLYLGVSVDQGELASAEGSHPFTAMTVEFECEYALEAGDDLVGDRLSGVDIGWDVKPDGAPDGVKEAVDQIDFPEE